MLYADETPARAAGGLRYVHIACTEFLTARHTGGRSAEDIDAGGVLPGYTGTIMRDGCTGYEHLTGAVHAWCGAHGLRDLAGLYRFDPGGRVWARSMADLLIWANEQATAARAAGQASLSGTQLAEICSWYSGAVGKGIADNPRRRSQTARDGLRLARRFHDHQDMILRFATDLAVGFTSNEAERGVRPVKAGRAPPADAGAPFRASPTSWPSRPTCPTAAKWGIDAPDALTQLFIEGPGYQPPSGPAE